MSVRAGKRNSGGMTPTMVNVRVAEAHGGTKRVRTAAEAPHPEVVADDRRERAAGDLVRRLEHPADVGADAEHVERTPASPESPVP